MVVNYASSRAGADEVVNSIVADGGRAVAVQGDVSKAAEAKAIVEAAVSNYGRLDVVVNNSGVYEFRPLEQVDEAHYRRLFDVNVLGLLLVTQAALPHLKEGASIINIGSVASWSTPPTTSVYSGTKGAVDAITGALSREFGPRKIRVNSVNPGIVNTEGTRSAGFVGSDFERLVVEQTPLGRTGQPQDVSSVVTFLASDDSAWISGELIKVAGGYR